MLTLNLYEISYLILNDKIFFKTLNQKELTSLYNMYQDYKQYPEYQKLMKLVLTLLF